MRISKEMLDELYVPPKVCIDLQSRYLEYPKGNKITEGVIERHDIGRSSHYDIRFSVDDHLVGFAIVGFNTDNPPTMDKLVPGKGFRAETKAIQPKQWLFKNLKIGEVFTFKPGEVGAGEEAEGHMRVLDRLKVKFGALKPYYLEYFVKGNTWKDWTRLVFRAIKVQKIDPKTKRPTGKSERMWRFMVAKDKTPYAISRGIKKGWKPPKGIVPFPEEWAKKNFPKEYERWIKYMRGELSELSSIKFTLGLSSWFGARAKSGRQMPQFRWFLLLDDKGSGKVRTFLLDGYPLKDKIMSAYELERSSRKWLTYEGPTQPDTNFNPNKRLLGKYTIIDRGEASYNTTIEEGVEIISLNFKGRKLKGKWEIRQEEKGTDTFVFEKLSQEMDLTKGVFVLDEHEFPMDSGKIHWDLRWKLGGQKYLEELNLYKDPRTTKVEEPIRAVRKRCYDMEWMRVKPKSTKMKAFGVWSKVRTLDHGNVTLLSDSLNFLSLELHGKKLRGFYIARKKDRIWEFMKSKLPGELSLLSFYYELDKEGDPREGKPFSPLRIEQRKGWDHFIVRIYDLRRFTKVEPDEKIKAYLPDLEIPKGVDIAIGLYSVPGRIHQARIPYVTFSKEWTYKDAIQWIKKNRLDSWGHAQIRKEG